MTDDQVSDPPGDAGAAPPDRGLVAQLADRVAPEVQAFAAGVAAVAASFAVVGNSPSFVAAPVSTRVVAYTPDVVVTASITLLGDIGNYLGLLTALVLTATVLGVAARPGIRLAEKTLAGGALLSGVLVVVVAGVMTAAPASSAAAAVGAVLVVAAPHVLPVGTAAPGDRRAVLAAIGAALGTALLGGALGSQVSPGGSAGRANPDGEVGELLSGAMDRSLDVDGLEPLVSEEFYNVDIAQFDPRVDTADWSLSVTGNVDEEVEYSFQDVRGREAHNRFVTLRCVGEALNGKKLDNALWTGVPLWDLVEPAAPEENCCVRLHAADDYYQVFPLAALKRGFLAYGMNGGPLPREHGAPARVLIPGHWGEINVKWIQEVEIIDRDVEGYWEERGWHGTGPVNTVAKLWATNHLDDGRVEVAGHAYAGTRGIERVEVSTDGGDSWVEATLSDPPPLADETQAALPTPEEGTPTPTATATDDLAAVGRDVWRQWVHRYDPPDGAHDVVVRAVDGTGAVQPEEQSQAVPSGATGWVSKTVNP
jgi:DMSO/TMAO reductase YedYZ molybdopterin-dependent catalytic subunit